MDKMKLTAENKKRISIIMLVFAALMLIDVVYQARIHSKWKRWMPKLQASEVAATQPAKRQAAATRPASDDGKDKKDKKGAKDKKKLPAVRAAIRKRNVFTAIAKPKGHEMKLVGVLWNEAIFRKKGKKGKNKNKDKDKDIYIAEGKSAEGIKVTKIDGYEVTIEYKGKSETMKLHPEIESSGGPPASKGAKSSPASAPEGKVHVSPGPGRSEADAAGRAETAAKLKAKAEKLKRRAMKRKSR